MIKKIYKETGMYIDWRQLSNSPLIDTFIDIGVGPKGTQDLYDYFPYSNLILIDPLDAAKKYAKKISKRNVVFFQVALGKKKGFKKMKIQKKMGHSSFLQISPINIKDNFTEIKTVKITTLDELLKNKSKLGKIGLKIDTEGSELDIILGAKKTLKFTRFVIAECRHNYESLLGVYKLHEFINEMHKNKFILTKILTAKPFIADLYFEPIKNL